MDRFKLVMTILFGLLLALGGINHFLKPDMYFGFIPEPLPALLTVYVSGVVEIFLGIGAIVPKSRSFSTLGMLLLMIAFLPLHIVDIFKENPTIGSHQMAIIRVPAQFILIAWTWFISRKI